jgi:uncharacterized DUF497 family protein
VGSGLKRHPRFLAILSSVTIEDQLRGDEVRYKTIGRLQNLILAVVVRTGDEEGGGIRIISARKATATERRLYETNA